MSHITPTVLKQVKDVVQESISVLTPRLTDCPNLPVQDFINVNDTYWLTDESATPFIDNLTVNGLTVNNYLNANVNAGISTINTFGITVLGTPGKVDANLVQANHMSTTNLQVYGNILCGGDTIMGDLTVDTIAANEIQATTWISTATLRADVGRISSIDASTITAKAFDVSNAAVNTYFNWKGEIVMDASASIFNGNTGGNLKMGIGTIGWGNAGFGAIGGGYNWPNGATENPYVYGPRFINTTNTNGTGIPNDWIRSSRFYSENTESSVLITPGNSYTYVIPGLGIYTIYCFSTTGVGAFRAIASGTNPNYSVIVITDNASDFTATATTGGVIITNNSSSFGSFITHCIGVPGV